MAMYSNTTRLTGLSGLDTESMVTQLMQAESQKLYKLQKNSTKLTWKQEAYQSVSSSLKAFQSKYLDVMSSSSIRQSATFNKYNSTVKISKGANAGSTSNAVSVTASGSNAAGSYTLEDIKLATKDTYSSKLDGSGNVAKKGAIESKKDVVLTELAENGGSFTLTLDGSTKTINIDKSKCDNMTNFTKYLQDEVDKQFGKDKVAVGADGSKLNFKPVGNGHTLSISDGAALSFSEAGSVALGQVDGSDGEKVDTAGETDLKDLIKGAADGKIKLNVSGEAIEIDFTDIKDKEDLSSDMILSKINSTLSSKGVYASFQKGDDGKVTLKTTGLSREAITIGNDSAGPNLMGALGFSGDVSFDATSTLSNMGIANGDSNHLGNDDTLESLFGTGLLVGTEVDENNVPKVDADGKPVGGHYEMFINDIKITLDRDDTVEDMMKKINQSGAGVTMKYDSLKESYSLQANSEGAMNAIKFGKDGVAGSEVNTKDAFTALGFDMTAPSTAAKDAEFKINGTVTSRSSNNFSYEGVNFTLKEETAAGEVLTIDVENNNDHTKEMLKDFVNAYNDLISGINGMVNEKRAKSNGSYYDPLTDEEKKAMSEDQIKSWESKAKEGILNRDSILSDITADMRTQLYQAVTLSDGSKLSLFQIGITTTSDYSEQGKLEIDEKALDEAIAKYGDKISELFTKSADKSLTGSAKTADMGLGDRLNNIIEKAASNTNGTLSKKAGAKTGHTQYSNDMLDLIRAENNKISDMLAYLTKKENDYYSMFSKLEAAMSEAESQMNYVSQMFGV